MRADHDTIRMDWKDAMRKRGWPMKEAGEKRIGAEARAAFSRLLQGAAGLLYPRGANCLCCGDPRRASQDDCLCESCRRALQEKRVPPGACPRCLSPMKKGKPCAFCRSALMQPLDRVYAPYRYAGEVRALIHAFKFDACDEALPILGGEMAASLTDRDFDCLVPVPLHKRRLRQRGVNQALLLCREIERLAGISTEEHLVRTHYRRPQSLLPARQRMANVKDAFSALPGAAGKRVLLVDDVRTTGSTACACASALIEAGAKSVSLCVCAVVYRKK